MHILQLTTLLLMTTRWPFVKSTDFLVLDEVPKGTLMSDAAIEIRFDSNSLMNDVAMFSNELQAIYEVQNPPLEGKDLYLSMVDYISERHCPDLDKAIVQAVMETESNYDPNAGNPSGAIGLMQIIPKWHQHRAEKYGLHDLWDPYTNILVGMDLINESYQKYGDYRQALYVYNHSWGYVDHVMCLADKIRGGD